MKNIYFLLILSLVFEFTSCVDDYTESNPPDQLDAPSLRIDASGNDDVVVHALPINKYEAYVNYGDPITFTVTVVDAPGKISAIEAASSIEEFGTVTVGDDANALIGKTNGTFTVTFTPSTELEDDSDRSLNLEVTVTDSQLDNTGKSKPKSTTLTVPVNLVNQCLSETITPGTYVVTDASGNLDGGEAYDMDLLTENSGSAFAANTVVVVITENRPGVYTLSDATGGLWTLTGGMPADDENFGGFNVFREAPELRVDLCGNEITGRTGYLTSGISDDDDPDNDEDNWFDKEVTFTLNGMVNDDGTITMNWSYENVDGNTPADPAMGSYTLTPLQ